MVHFYPEVLRAAIYAGADFAGLVDEHSRMTPLDTAMYAGHAKRADILVQAEVPLHSLDPLVPTVKIRPTKHSIQDA